MKMPIKPKVVIVGCGVSALVTAIELADSDVDVYLFTNTILGNDAACQESTINLAVDTHGAWNEEILSQDIIKAGAGLAEEALVNRVVEASKTVLGRLGRLGVQIDLTSEGFFKSRAALGTTHCYSYASTAAPLGRQLLNKLVDEVRAREHAKRLFTFERWDFLSLVKGDTGAICGIVAENQEARERLVFKADAVVLAGGNHEEGAFALMQAYASGATLANMELTTVNPYVWRLGGSRIAVPAVLIDSTVDFTVTRHGEPFQILKEWNASDVAHSDFTEVYRSLFELKNLDEFKHAPLETFIDLTRLASSPLYDSLRVRLIKYSQADIKSELLPVEASLEQNLGGLCVNQIGQTTITNLYAAGAAAAGFYGAGEVCGTRLLHDYCSGELLAADLKKILPEIAGNHLNETDDVYRQALNRERLKYDDILDQTGPENIHELGGDLNRETRTALLWTRDAETLLQALNNLNVLRDRFTRVQLSDRGKDYNRQITFLREFPARIDMAEIQIKAMLARQESRGFYLRRDFPQADDRFLKPSFAVRDSYENRVFFESNNVVKLNVG